MRIFDEVDTENNHKQRWHICHAFLLMSILIMHNPTVCFLDRWHQTKFRLTFDTSFYCSFWCSFTWYPRFCFPWQLKQPLISKNLMAVEEFPPIRKWLKELPWRTKPRVGYHKKGHKNSCQKQLPKVILHFVWGHQSRKQTVTGPK